MKTWKNRLECQIQIKFGHEETQPCADCLKCLSVVPVKVPRAYFRIVDNDNSNRHNSDNGDHGESSEIIHHYLRAPGAHILFAEYVNVQAFIRINIVVNLHITNILWFSSHSS